MKISMKRVAALVLTLVMVFGLLPVVNNTVNAVDVTGLNDSSIGLSYANLYQPNGNVSSWTASGNAINGVLQGVKRGAIYMKAESTLTIKNNKSSAANLSFDYTVTTLNGSTVTIDGTAATGGSFEKKLEAGETVSIVLASPQTTGNKDNKVTISISNLILASASNDPVTTTFEAPAYGSYTVAYGNESLTVAAGTASQTATNLPSVAYTLTANPGEGYKLVGWYNVTKDVYLGTEATYVGAFEEVCTVKAVIVPEDTAVFMVSDVFVSGKDAPAGNYYVDLNEAVAYAQANNKAQITLVQSGVLAAGNYTVPAGVTLLIPMDTEYTPTRTDDEDFGVAPEYTTDVVTPYAFLTLTMEDGVKLTVNGTLDVESKHTTYQGSKTTGGRPCGPYGAIYMNPGSNITMNNGSNLYAWGYIYGDGTVDAESGAKVYEIMQVTDFPGGSNMSLFVDTDPTVDTDGDGIPSNDYIKTFPFSQYYVQNIEVALSLKEGAAEYVYITMTAGGQSMGLPVRFIGEGGMFVPDNGGTIVKDYDPSADRLNVTVNGNASMAGIALDLTGTKYEGAVGDVLGTSKVDSATFILTLNGNISINIASGTTTIKQDLALLPGVEITVAQGATLVVAERNYADDEHDNLTFDGTGGYNIYVWDMENWGQYVFSKKYFSALSYSPTTGRYTRKYSDLKDVKIDINGTVLSEGYIYSTVTYDEENWVPVSGGAQIISSGKTGKLVLQNGAGTEEFAYCLDGTSSCDSAMLIDSVWLQNGDGSYVLTDGAEAGTTYSYCDVHDLWYTEGHGNCVVIYTYEVTWIVDGQGAPEEYLQGETPFYKGGTPTKAADGCTVYTFAGWATSANGQVLAELPAVTGDAVYFAIFTSEDVHSFTTKASNKLVSAADCDSAAVYYVQCDNCSAISDTETVEVGSANGHTGGTAYCSALKVCAACGERYGSLDPNNHTEIGYYENEADNKHHIYYSCCGTYGASEPCTDREDDGDHSCDYCVNNGITSCVSDAAHDCQSGVCVECGTEMPAVVDHGYDYECDKICNICGDEVWPDNDHYQFNGCDTQCYYCGEEAWPDAVCQSDAENACEDGVCVWCGQPVAAAENHDWVDPDCVNDGYCGNCGEPGEPALGHGTIEGWEYHQLNNDVHQVECKDCYEYNFNQGHNYVSHVCKDCEWVEMISVKFYNGSELWADTEVPYGEMLGIAGMPVPAAPTGYSFSGWYTEDGEFVAHGMTITSEIVAYATFAKNSYTVTWIVDGNTITESYKYGDVPSFKGSTDKASDGCTSYTFTGWDNTIAAVTGNVTYTAVYSSNTNHQGGKATCSAQAVCGNCGESYGALDADNHASDTVVYKNITETTHDEYYACCQNVLKAANVPHTYVNGACDCTAKQSFTVTWLFNGGVMDEQWKQLLISEGFTVTDTSASNSFVYGNFAPDVTGVTKEGYTLIGYTDQYGNFNEGQEIFTLAEDMTFTLVWECDHTEKTYTDLKNGYHKVTCGTCGDTLVESEAHDYTYDKRNHKCQCGAVEEFKLTVVYGINGEHKIELMVPYWTPMADLEEINNIPRTPVYVNDATHLGYYELYDFYWDMDGDGDLDWDRYFSEGYMPARDMYVEARYEFNGFVHDGNGWQYRKFGSFYKNVMITPTMADLYENGSEEEIEGIYMMDANGYRIENGLGRWYYLGEWNGVTYEPNAEDIAYYENKGQTFIDKEKTWYYFGADGKLQFNYTGLVDDSYVVNGQAAWHVGLVQIDGDYYYFKGDEVNGGNKMVSGGDFYLNRNNTDFNMVVGGIYTFDESGVMQLFHGITESDLFEGKRHYIGGRLTPGLGLVDLTTVATGEVRYFYVDSYGQLILDAEYYVGANSFGLKKGIYYFDAEGFLVIPEPEVGKSGLFFENGKWFYYVDGAKAYCAGLIEIDGNWVYVKSDGSLATGVYYVTNTNDHATIASGTKCTFDANGVMINPVIGVQVLAEGSKTYESITWDESEAVLTFTPSGNGKLIIDVANIVLDGEYENVGFCTDILTEDGWMEEIFVLGDGTVEYDVSADMGECLVFIYPAMIEDDEYRSELGGLDYKVTVSYDGSPKNGIIDGYYYVDGHIAYAAGLIEIDGIYYYVRSNGQIVTDCQYWITNVNDTGYEPGLYEFDADGWMSEIYVETFTGIKDGYFYDEDKIAYNAGLKIYNGGYIYVRSNGQVATGKYWITNHNDLLPEGFYDFGEDGFYYPAIPENAYLVKDVTLNTETDGGNFGIAEAICPSADGYLYIQVTDVTHSEAIWNEAGFYVNFDSPDYQLASMDTIRVVGTGTVMVPVSAGDQLVVYVKPADVSVDGYAAVEGTITYKIWSTMECELVEIPVGQ